MINQGLVEIGNLPGLEEDHELEAELQADVVANKAFRCGYAIFLILFLF